MKSKLIGLYGLAMLGLMNGNSHSSVDYNPIPSDPDIAIPQGCNLFRLTSDHDVVKVNSKTYRRSMIRSALNPSGRYCIARSLNFAIKKLTS